MRAQHTSLLLVSLWWLGGPARGAGEPSSPSGPWRLIERIEGRDVLPARTDAQSGDVQDASVRDGDRTLRGADLPRAYAVFQLDAAEMRRALDRAWPESLPAEGRRLAVLEVPMPDGRSSRFAIQESPIMEPALAAAWPDIRTYAGQGIDDPAATGRFDWTPAGFHGFVLSPDGAFVVDPYLERGDTRHAVPSDSGLYISYRASDAAVDPAVRCHVGDDPASSPDGSFMSADPSRWYAHADALPSAILPSPIDPSTVLPSTFGPPPSLAPSSAVGPTLRTYRLAVAATGEYTSTQGGTVGAALASITTTINRVTEIFEQQFAVRLVLIANETAIIYTNGATDPYTNGCRECVLPENQANLDSVIGTANYDVGQVFMSFGGGFAFFAVVCSPSNKARGSSGGPGFQFDILVSHEIGHQFDARHTFNGTTDGCTQDQRSPSTAWEPGSGSTIMSYAGSCGAENIQNEWDPYFHSGCYNQVVSFFTTGNGTCSAQTGTGNSAPTVDAGAGYTIPISTPFTLTASGGDPDGDPTTYRWEELDVGTASPPSTDDGSRPIFRSFPSTPSPSRTFPKLADILSGVPTFGESLPVTNRTMTFQVAAHDNRTGGGGVNTDVTQITSTKFGGPFTVTFPNTATTLPGGSTQSVTWSVAGTSAPPVGTTNVKISLSTNGGLAFPVVLAASTPNDGQEWVTIPNTPTSAARIKVEAVGNVFFDISNQSSTIVSDPHAPLFALSAVAATAVGGDGDGFLEPGEAARLSLELRNTGTAAATGIQATLSSSTPGVTVITTQPLAYPPLSPSQSATNPQPFLIALASSLPCGQDLALTLTVSFSPGSGSSVLPFQVGIGEATTTTVSYTTPPVAIPDNTLNGVDVPLTVSGLSGSILDLDFSFDGTSCSPAAGSTTGGLSHTAVGDLRATLISPGASSVTLLDRPGGGGNSGNHFCQTRLDDPSTSSIQSIVAGGAPYVGTFRPESPLALFRGEAPNGVWTLRVADLKPVDTGTVRKFSLRITHPECNASASPPGETPEAAPDTPLTVTASGGDLTLSWGASCRPGGVDYAVYQGTIGSWYDHEPLFCTTEGVTTKTFPADPGNHYFLIVPQSGEHEGSYGRSSAGMEIPSRPGACRPQLLGGCP